MRICLVTETFPPEVNGVARTLRRWVDGLEDRGHSLEIIRPRQPIEPDRDRDTPDELLVRGTAFPMYKEMRFGWPAARRLTRRWRGRRPDVIQIATEGPLGWSALRAARRLDIPVISSFHTNFHQYSELYGFGFLVRQAIRYLRWFHNRTLCTLVPSPDAQSALEARGFERLVQVGRGVDNELFDPARRSDALRAEWGVGPDDPVILYVGRLAVEKNIGLATRAMTETMVAVAGSRGVLVGEGPEGETLRREHPDLVFCGLQRGCELATHYASGDILVFPSLSETFGNVVTEAMASGVPPVAYDCAAAGLHVRDGENGLVVPPGDEEALVEATRSLATDLRLARRLGAAARATALGLSWDRIVGQLEEVLLEASSSPRDRTFEPRDSPVPSSVASDGQPP